jgi:hypothetical protein
MSVSLDEKDLQKLIVIGAVTDQKRTAFAAGRK